MVKTARQQIPSWHALPRKTVFNPPPRKNSSAKTYNSGWRQDGGVCMKCKLKTFGEIQEWCAHNIVEDYSDLRWEAWTSFDNLTSSQAQSKMNSRNTVPDGGGQSHFSWQCFNDAMFSNSQQCIVLPIFWKNIGLSVFGNVWKMFLGWAWLSWRVDRSQSLFYFVPQSSSQSSWLD